MQSNNSINTTYDQIVYYFYYMLHDRLSNLRENEKTILSFFDACNAYLYNNANVFSLVTKAFRAGSINEADVALLCGITQEEAKNTLSSLREGQQKVDDFFTVK